MRNFAAQNSIALTKRFITYLLLGCYTIVLASLKFHSAFDSLYVWFWADMIFSVCVLITFPIGIGFCVYAIIQRESWSFRIIAPLWMTLIIIAAFLMPGYNDLEKIANHYERYHENISELRHYGSKVLDDSCYMRLEITPKGKVGMFACATKEESSLKWYGSDYEQGMSSIGLTSNELDSLLFFLRKSDCIGLVILGHTTGEIWCRRPNVMDLYSYKFYDQPMSIEQWNDFIDSYSSVPYCDTVAFIYGGPAFGSDMIPKDMKERFMNHHNIQVIATE